jgi:hypothetical protein
VRRLRTIAILCGLALVAFIGYVAHTFAGGAPGTLIATPGGLGFVKSPATVFLAAPGGVDRVSLDGRRRQRAMILAPGLSVAEVSRDFALYVLRNSDTDLFVAEAPAGVPREVVPLRHRLSAVAISPDGHTVAASRHSDFSLPQREWRDDDAIYLIDVASLAVRTLPPSSSDWPTRLAWTEDGTAVVALMAFERPGQRITVADGQRHSIPAGWDLPPGTSVSPLHARVECNAHVAYGQSGTDIRVESAGTSIVVAREVGKTGFHGPGSDFDDPRWAPGCTEVAFGFRHETWLAAGSGSGEVAPLAQGVALFFGPPFEAASP